MGPGVAPGAPTPKGDADACPTGALTGGNMVKLFTAVPGGGLLPGGNIDICPTGAPNELLKDGNADMLPTCAVVDITPEPGIPVV